MLKTSDLIHAPHVSRQMPNGQWIPALPLPYYGLLPRLKDAWKVLTGKAQAIQEG